MLNFIQVFDVMEVSPTSGEAIWTGRTGTRTALQRDGFMIDPKASAYCPTDWLDERGYLVVEPARRRPRPRFPEHLMTRRTDLPVGSELP